MKWLTVLGVSFVIFFFISAGCTSQSSSGEEKIIAGVINDVKDKKSGSVVKMIPFVKIGTPPYGERKKFFNFLAMTGIYIILK